MIDATPSRDPRVVVVMSTYEGDQYLEEQLASLRAQTYSGWTLLIRDDGSGDATPALLQEAAARDSRLLIVRDGRGNLGPVRSFGALLARAHEAGAEYVALCDQDDVWRPDKLERQLELLRRREREVGGDTPLLVHSDLEVVDDNLSPVHPSFLQFQGFGDPPPAPLNRLLVQNFVTGCSVLLNRSLLAASLPLPQVVMHDWWLALCAAAMGELLYIPEPLVRYRQHATNVVGSRGRAHLLRTLVRRPLDTWRAGGSYYAESLSQACELARRIGRERRRTGRPLPSNGFVEEYCATLGRRGGPWRRWNFVRRHRVVPHYRVYPVYYYARVLLSGAATPPAAELG